MTTSSAETEQYLRRGALALLGVALAGFLADYVFNAVVSRTMSPHEYGDFRVAWSFASLFGVVILLGGDRAAPKVLATVFERRELAAAWEYLRFYMLLALGLAAGVMLVTWSISYLHTGHTDPLGHHPLAWAVLSIPINAAGALASRALQSAKYPTLANLPWRLGVPLLNLALIGAFFAVNGALGAHHALVLATLTILAITAWQWHELRRREMPALVRDPTKADPRRWLQLSLPMMGVFIVTLALNQSDLYFLELLGEEHQVGHYAAAMTTAHFVLVIQTALVGLTAPVMQIALDRNDESARVVEGQSQRVLLTVLAPPVVALVVLAPHALWAFGPSFVDAAFELRLLLVGNLCWAAVALSVLWLQYTHRGLALVALTVTTLVVDSALDIALIPRFGMTGAAASTAATTIAAAAAVWLLRRRFMAGAGPSVYGRTGT